MWWACLDLPYKTGPPSQQQLSSHAKSSKKEGASKDSAVEATNARPPPDSAAGGKKRANEGKKQQQQARFSPVKPAKRKDIAAIEFGVIPKSMEDNQAMLCSTKSLLLLKNHEFSRQVAAGYYLSPTTSTWKRPSLPPLDWEHVNSRVLDTAYREGLNRRRERNVEKLWKERYPDQKSVVALPQLNKTLDRLKCCKQVGSASTTCISSIELPCYLGAGLTLESPLFQDLLNALLRCAYHSLATAAVSYTPPPPPPQQQQQPSSVDSPNEQPLEEEQPPQDEEPAEGTSYTNGGKSPNAVNIPRATVKSPNARAKTNAHPMTFHNVATTSASVPSTHAPEPSSAQTNMPPSLVWVERVCYMDAIFWVEGAYEKLAQSVWLKDSISSWFKQLFSSSAYRNLEEIPDSASPSITVPYDIQRMVLPPPYNGAGMSSSLKKHFAIVLHVSSIAMIHRLAAQYDSGCFPNIAGYKVLDFRLSTTVTVYGPTLLICRLKAIAIRGLHHQLFGLVDSRLPEFPSTSSQQGDELSDTEREAQQLSFLTYKLALICRTLVQLSLKDSPSPPQRVGFRSHSHNTSNGVPLTTPLGRDNHRDKGRDRSRSRSQQAASGSGSGSGEGEGEGERPTPPPSLCACSLEWGHCEACVRTATQQIVNKLGQRTVSALDRIAEYLGLISIPDPSTSSPPPPATQPPPLSKQPLPNENSDYDNSHTQSQEAPTNTFPPLVWLPEVLSLPTVTLGCVSGGGGGRGRGGKWE